MPQASRPSMQPGRAAPEPILLGRASARSALLLTVSLGLMFGMACGHAVPRSGPYVWQLRGAVVSATNDLLRVQHKTGGIVEL